MIGLWDYLSLIARGTRMRLFKLVLLFIVVLLQYHLWFGKNSIQDYFSLQQQVEHQQLANNVLSERNDVLAAEIHDLRNGLAAAEEHARNELGLIKQGETFYRIISSAEKP